MDADYSRDTFVPGLEVREGRNGEPTRLIGYAAVFNQESIINGPDGAQWRERIAPGAFQDVIGRDDVIAAVNHDDKMVLGRSRKGTLLLTADATGLRYEVKLPNTTVARDTIENVRNGNYPGSSFKFTVARDGLRVEKPATVQDLPLIVIERVKGLQDVGPVTFPAYEGTSVSVRQMPQLVSDVLRQAAEDAVVANSIAARDRVALRIRIERAKAWAG